MDRLEKIEKQYEFILKNAGVKSASHRAKIFVEDIPYLILNLRKAKDMLRAKTLCSHCGGCEYCEPFIKEFLKKLEKEDKHDPMR